MFSQDEQPVDRAHFPLYIYYIGIAIYEMYRVFRVLCYSHVAFVYAPHVVQLLVCRPPPPSPILGPPGTSALEFVCRLQYELSWTQFPELVRFSVVTKSEGKTHLVLTFTVRVYI